MIGRLIRSGKSRLRLLRETDWEFFFAYCFIHLKYGKKAAHCPSLKHAKLAFMERRFAHLLTQYRDMKFSPKSNGGPIWVCWLQGEKAMPAVVRMCYERLKTMSPPGRELVLLHQGNLADYVQIPEHILQKVEQGVITRTHFSDIIRFALLAEHGGLWVDSTVYASSPIPESVFSQAYYSARPDNYAEYIGVNRCLWKCFLIGGAAHSPWFSCARDIVYEYWSNMNFLLDYLLVDYILLSIYDCNGSVKSGVDAGVEYAPYISEFEKWANEPFDSEKMDEMCQTSRWFKLSYKLPFREKTEDGQMTNYGSLVASSRGEQS